MPSFEVWVEGYAATGEHGTAQFWGTYEGETFAEACEIAANDKNRNWDKLYFNKERLTYWGCRLFDNEADARRAFG